MRQRAIDSNYKRERGLAAVPACTGCHHDVLPVDPGLPISRLTLMVVAVLARQFEKMPFTVTQAATLDQENRQRLQALYDHSPEFASGADAMQQLQQALAAGDRLYIGWFNDKPIAALWSRQQPDGHDRLLQYIVVHPANRGRGIAEQLMSQVMLQERTLGVQAFQPGCGAIRRLLTRLQPMH